MLIRFFDYYGGKIREVMKLLSIIPSKGFLVWIEAYAGSAVLTLNKVKNKIEILNDRDWGLTNLFKLMADRETGRELLDRLLKLKYSESEFMRAKRAYLNDFKNVDNMRAAELYFVLVTQSFNATKETWRKGVPQDKYTHSLEKNLPLVYNRLDGVRVLNTDALDLIRKFKNNSKAFIFLDPPYRHELRGKSACSVYTYEMDNTKQIQLLKLIQDAQCNIMLCGYRSKDGQDIYDRYLIPHGWIHLKVADLVKACQYSSGGRAKDFGTEWVWINYKIPLFAEYAINVSTKNIR